jgi:hypothetical protein
MRKRALGETWALRYITLAVAVMGCRLHFKEEVEVDEYRTSRHMTGALVSMSDSGDFASIQKQP